jgi:hypothetical protein
MHTYNWNLSRRGKGTEGVQLEPEKVIAANFPKLGKIHAVD